MGFEAGLHYLTYRCPIGFGKVALQGKVLQRLPLKIAYFVAIQTLRRVVEQKYRQAPRQWERP